MDAARGTHRRPRAAALRGWTSVATVAAVTVLVVALPRLLGTSWRPIVTTLDTLSAGDLALLTALWLAGLLSYAGVLTSSMPGLGTRRALLLNLTGSAVANVAPFGGAAGVGLNFAMVRSWRFSRATFATFTAVSNLWDWLGKLMLAALVLGWVLLHHRIPAGALATALRTALLVVSAVLLVAAATLASDTVVRVLGRGLDRLVWFRPAAFATSLPTLRTAMVGVIRRRWARLTGAMVGYLALQAVLLGTCLHLVGSDLAMPAVLAGFAAERLATLVPVTPGGAGLADTACAGVLIALGGDPVLAAAAVLIYRAYTYLLEIPVGGLGIVGWVLVRRQRRAA